MNKLSSLFLIFIDYPLFLHSNLSTFHENNFYILYIINKINKYIINKIKYIIYNNVKILVFFITVDKLIIK